MNLTNFKLGSMPQATELTGFNHNWDLHNFVDFQGFSMNVKEQEFRLTWKVPGDLKKTEAWGDPTNVATGCSLVFTGVDFLSVFPTRVSIRSSENLTLFGISKIIPGDSKVNGFKSVWKDSEDFRLLFEFGEEIDIEIHSNSVELKVL